MKRELVLMMVLLVMVLLVSLSCRNEDVNPDLDVYNEWEWKVMTFDTRGNPISSFDLDSTYYYNFRKDGILEMKDVNKVTRVQYAFTILDINQPMKKILVEDTGVLWGYTIRKDSLFIWDAVSIFPRTTIFKAARR